MKCVTYFCSFNILGCALIQIPDLICFIYKYTKTPKQTDDASSSNMANGHEGDNEKSNAISYIDSRQTNREEFQESRSIKTTILKPDFSNPICTTAEMGEIMKRMDKMERNFDLLLRTIGVNLESDASN